MLELMRPTYYANYLKNVRWDSEGTTLARISEGRRRGDDNNMEPDHAKLKLDPIPLNEGYHGFTAFGEECGSEFVARVT